MINIPLHIFLDFKNKCNKKIILFGKEIIPKNIKKNTFKKKTNELSLYLNKINYDNYKFHVKNYLENNYISKDNFSNFTIDFYKKILSENSFTESYLLFYIEIIKAYYKTTNFNLSYFINLIETKFKSDFTNEKVLLGNFLNDILKLPDDLTEIEIKNYQKTFKINNLKIIYLLIKNNYLSKNIYDYIYPILSTPNYSEFLYELLKENNDIEYINKLNIDEYDLRIKTLIYELKKEKNIKKFYIINCKNKDVNKIMIENIIEEYLFIDEIDEVKLFIDNHIIKKNLQIKFVETALNYGKKKHLDKEIKKMLELVSPILKKKPVITKYLC